MKLMEEQNPEVSETKSVPQLPVMGVSKPPLMFTVFLGFFPLQYLESLADATRPCILCP